MRAIEKLLATKRLLTNLSRDFTPVAMFQTFSVEDMVLADLIYADLVHQEYSNIKMFTIDTGRLPDESHHLMERVRERYGNVLKVYYPETSDLEQHDATYASRSNHQDQSNAVRLLKPLQRALQGHKAWISGSDALNLAIDSNSWMAWDDTHQIPRFNPLSRWIYPYMNISGFRTIFVPPTQSRGYGGGKHNRSPQNGALTSTSPDENFHPGQSGHLVTY